MPVVGNRIKVASSSTGTGNITLGSAEDGYQTFAAGGINDNNVVRYVITEGSSWEIGKGTYLTSGPTLVRTSGNLLESSTGSLLNLGGSATVFVSLADVDVMQTDGGTFTGDVTFDGATAGRDIVFNRSTSQLKFSDNAKVVFGDGTDATIHWNGSALEFSSELGDVLIRGNNEIKLQAHTGENFFVGLSNGASTLYYDNAAKLATTSTGIDVTGTVTDDGAAHDGDVTFTGASYNVVWDKSDNALEFADNAKAVFGAGSDLQIYHDASHTYIAENGTGNLYIQGNNLFLRNSAGTENYISAISNGAVTLFHDNAAKLATTSTGVSVTGDVAVSGSVYASTNIGKDSGDYITFTTDTQMDVYINGSNEFRFEADGDFHADGNVIAYSTTIASDASLKENIKPVLGLQSVMALDGVSFDWKRDGKKSAGVIAQQVQKIMPEAVTEVKAMDGSKHLSVNYNALTSILIEAIKELKTEIEVLKNASSK